MLTKGVYAPELDSVSKGGKLLMNEEKGDDVGFELDDVFDDEWQEPLVDDVLSGALGALGDFDDEFGDGVVLSRVRSMKFAWDGLILILGLLVELVCGSVRIVEFLLFVFDKDFEEEAIVGD